MIPELGQFALILALLTALVQATVPLAGLQQGRTNWMALARPTAYAQLLFLAVAFAALGWAFYAQDFSVLFVAENSNLRLPWYYRLTAIWGGHEGSLVLWMLLYGAWMAAVARFSRSLPEAYVTRVLAVLGMISVGFLLFTLLTSNPFERVIPAVPDGRDLNPLLQDPGMIIHPPMLYMGYVGFSVAFAFAIASLMGGRLDRDWARWTRPWTLVAWGFLTLGIALGSWWAYYELGWGGWWFWDPVENASFMPWLVGTALIHSQAVTEHRGAFRGWTVLLAICAFSLSLLGTFLVRSGVLTSVHAFANDPTRGLFILAFLGVVTGGALTLYAFRAPRMASGGPIGFVSRESALLVNNLFFAVAAATVLLGTLYPLIIDALGMGRISVGAPYFGLMFTLLMAPLIVLLPAGPFLRWKEDDPSRVVRRLWLAAALAAGVALASLLALREWSVMAFLGVLGGTWVIAGTLDHFRSRLKTSGRRVLGVKVVSRGALGMTLAHLGVGLFVLGATLTGTQSVERDVAMQPGQVETIGPYQFRFEGVDRAQGPNYSSQMGTVRVARGDREVAVLNPEKRRYGGNSEVMTEAAINAGLTRDLYVALGNPMSEGGGWSVRMYHKAFVRFIWLGALFMMFGSFIAASDPRYRRASRQAAARAGDTLAAEARA
jgi:cytochrome c-type biogenesis protein CcmF